MTIKQIVLKLFTAIKHNYWFLHRS